jgi:hypothetical protein
MALNTTAGKTEGAQHETVAELRDNSPDGDGSRS